MRLIGDSRTKNSDSPLACAYESALSKRFNMIP